MDKCSDLFVKLEHDFSINYKTHSSSMYNYHIHDYFEVVFIVSDYAVFIVGETVYYTKPNSLILLNNTDLHKVYLPDKEPYERYVLTFRPEYIESLSFDGIDLTGCFLFRPFPDAHYIPLSSDQIERFTHLLDKLISTANMKEKIFGQNLLIRFLLGELLININHIYYQYHNIIINDFHSDYNSVYQVINYIHKNLNAPMSLDILARKIFVNKNYLCTLFKKVTGFTPNKYIINCRLMKAKELLIQNIPVETVCTQVGFNNLSHFSRTFKQYIGISPKKYMQKNIL